MPVTVFERGSAQIFDRKGKQKLYWKAKQIGMQDYRILKNDNYGLIRFSDKSSWFNMTEQEYNAKKIQFLTRFADRKKVEVKNERLRAGEKMLVKVMELSGLSPSALSTQMGLASDYLSSLCSHIRKRMPVEEELLENEENDALSMQLPIQNLEKHAGTHESNEETK